MDIVLSAGSLNLNCGSILADVQAFQTLARIAAVLSALTTAAKAVLHEGVASGMPDSPAAQLGTAANTVQEPLQVLLSHDSGDEDGSLDQLMVQLRPLLQPAAGLAALMQQYYALPAVEQPRQLAVAQAAAGRCCAYLRCANVGGEGGPAAGEGVGSKRCRWALRGWAVGGCLPHPAASVVGSCACWPCCRQHSINPTIPCAAHAVRCGTAAPPARTPTGGRAGTAACAGRWARCERQRRRLGGQLRQRRQQGTSSRSG